ncbi:type IV toxin-antitoxin system AbiEi family antitoxin domain-containing protein [Georgenia muralis]|uniref:type IV toxin-antitoxin system AbiEi family antitoxin domain-containing protein n=1 Tax=Georgenia muralis TaxID=154117 RepID=UPI000F50FAA8|nr:hypothetical protein [Georgenia muralis]
MATTHVPRGLVRLGRADPATAVSRDRASRRPDLLRVRRGTYVERERWRAATVSERHRYLVLGTLDVLRGPAVLSHESAAVLHGLPIVGPAPQQVHVTSDAARGGRSSAGIRRHRVQTIPSVTSVGGVLVTSVARTVVDLARGRPLASALPAADHALRTGAATREDLMVELDQVNGARGARRARAVVLAADGRSESVGESVSRARMMELGLPLPELQREFRDADGFVARTDFWWESLRLAGEFDGRTKYGAGGTEVLWREKQREDRLRLVVGGVVRWTWTDAWDVDRFRAVMARVGVVAR